MIFKLPVTIREKDLEGVGRRLAEEKLQRQKLGLEKKELIIWACSFGNIAKKKKGECRWEM